MVLVNAFEGRKVLCLGCEYSSDVGRRTSSPIRVSWMCRFSETLSCQALTTRRKVVF